MTAYLMLRTVRLIVWGAFILSLGAATAWRQDVNIGRSSATCRRYYLCLPWPPDLPSASIGNAMALRAKASSKCKGVITDLPRATAC